MKKSFFTLTLIALLVFAFCGIVNANATDSDTCGDALTWTLDDTGTLTISGTGKMTDWGSSGEQPWNEYDSSIRFVIIEEGVTSIGSFAFCDCNNLTSISLPNSLTTINLFPFGNCSSLSEINISKNVTKIGNDFESNFSGCTKLTAIHVDEENPKYISVEGALFNKSMTRLLDYPANSPNSNFTIPKTVTFIAEEAFHYNNLSEILVDNESQYYTSENGVLLNRSKTNLLAYPHGNTQTTYTIPSSVTLIGASAFRGSNNLVEILIPHSVAIIEDNAFADCNKLSNIIFPNSVISIGSGLFKNCRSLKSVTLSAGITEITHSLFYGCVQLQEVIIPSGITTISDFSFYGCTGLTTITLPNSITIIGIGAFQRCINLSHVILPNSMAIIKQQAFFDCTNLQTVYYGGSEADWNNITIDIRNDPLLNATIIYQSIPDFFFTDFTTTSSGFAITANLSQQLKEQNGIILFAVYHNNFLKRFVPFSAAESVTHNFTSLASGEYTIKAFYWSDLANIQPLCAPAEKTFSL